MIAYQILIGITIFLIAFYISELISENIVTKKIIFHVAICILIIFLLIIGGGRVKP
jgi:hypothetical protein